MPMVKVWNDNIHDHKEDFKGQKLVIPSGEFIEMEYEEAIEFKGQYTPMPPEECQDPSPYYKMIRVESPPPGSIFRDDDTLMNHATGRRATTREELSAQVSELRHLLVTDKAAEEAAGAKDTRIANLEKQIAELNDRMKSVITIKKGPGRPKKEAAG